MSMTLTPSSGPMVCLLPAARLQRDLLGPTNGTAPARSRAAGVWAYAQGFVGWAKRSVPTTLQHARKVVGTAQGRLCPPYGFSNCLLHRLQQRDVIGNRSAAHVEDAGEFCVPDLHALGRLTQQLHRRHHMHGDAGGTDRVAFSLQTAGGIDRHLAAFLGPPFFTVPT